MNKANKDNGDGTLSNSQLESHRWEAANILAITQRVQRAPPLTSRTSRLQAATPT